MRFNSGFKGLITVFGSLRYVLPFSLHIKCIYGTRWSDMFCPEVWIFCLSCPIA